MIIVPQSHAVITPFHLDKDAVDRLYQQIETAGRTCYKSQLAITEDSARQFVKKLTENRHEAMLEHASITVRFVTSRAVSHELVRHRMASFAQLSQRYVNYAKEKFGREIPFIMPTGIEDGSPEYNCMYNLFSDAEYTYLALVDSGTPPEIARAVLPNATATEIVVTANLREWRHILFLRAAGTTGKPHPDMQALMLPVLDKFRAMMPEVFGDIPLPVTK